MPSLLIRKVDPSLHAKLKARAAAHHRSLEEEARVLLRSGLTRPDDTKVQVNIVDLAERLFGEKNGIDLDLPPRDRLMERKPPDSVPDSQRGTPIPLADTMIAGAALAIGAGEATRNVADFTRCGFVVENPWDIG
jgi:antitoxin FitA